MDRALNNTQRRLVLFGFASLSVISVLAIRTFLDGPVFMESGSDTPATSTTGTGSEGCVLGMVPPAPEDTPLPSDQLLHPNARETIQSNQEAIEALKRALARGNCAESPMIRQHIQMLRNEIASIRGGVIPIRPPYNLD